MNEDNPKDWNKSVEHPSEDELLCFIDGELSPKLIEGLRSHLDACWHCRNRAEKFQAAISRFVDYRSQVMQPLIESSDNWSGFGSKLRNQTADRIPPTFWERWQSAWRRFRLSLPTIDARVARLTTISALTIILGFAGVYFLLISTSRIVSAEELINLAAQSRENELKNTDQPVLYQQLRVRRRNARGEETSNVEIWQDIDNLRIRKVVSPQADNNAMPVLTDLEHILRANNYEPPPLSVVGFRAWRERLADKHDTVEQLRTDDDVAAIRLKTEVAATTENGRITSSELIVRAADYHPIEQKFTVNSTDGPQEFEFRETSFAVMSLNSLNPGFFVDSTPMVVSARPSPKPSIAESPEANVSEPGAPNAAVTGASANAVASADLEVGVLNLLHNAGADLGEQVEVRRTPNGPIVVSGVVDTPERKGQILNALGSVKDNPAVRIQISTVAEYLARQKQGKPTPRPSVESVEVEGDTFPAEADLRARFNDDANVKAFAARMTGRSSQAMNYLWAMKRLKSQFSLAELQKLTPEARAKWLGVIRSYARSYQNEIAGLKRELQPVFGGSGGGGSAGAINSDAELLQTIDQLFAAGSGTNQAVRGSLTTSAAGVNTLKMPQFWQMLNRAEALAASIEKAK
jgi:hypothetical protein